MGCVSGAVAISPIAYLHTYTFPSEIIVNELSQFQFDTFTGAIARGSFTSVYRYFLKEVKDNILVNNVVGAFVLAKLFSRIRTSYYCEGLYCGAPLGFMDWDMSRQFVLSAADNLALFGAMALVIEYACDRGYIRRDCLQYKHG